MNMTGHVTGSSGAEVVDHATCLACGCLCDDIRVVEVPGADHGMKVLAGSPLGAAGVRDLLVDTVAGFVLGLSPRP